MRAGAFSSDRYFEILGRGRRHRDRLPVLSYAGKVHLDGALHQRLRFGKVIARSDASRKVWRIATIPGARLLVDHKVLHDFSPACLRMLFNVPGAASLEGCPAIVT